MQEYREPLFRKGRVLKKESLEALRDFPGELSRLGLSGWSDGVLYGFEISYEDGGKMQEDVLTQGYGVPVHEGTLPEQNGGQLVVGAGAVWYEGQLVLTKPEILPFTAYDQQITVRLRLHPMTSTEDFDVRPLEFCVGSGEPGNGEMELGRFRLSKGARLRKDYRDFRDFRTAYNTLDITQIPYAGLGGVTVSPVLLRAFARMVLENKTADGMDVSFALMCLNHQQVTRECLLHYISRRLGAPYRELSHSEIYERLARIAGPGGQGMEQRRRMEGPAVL